MGRTNKDAKTLDLVSIWLGRNDQWIYASDIRKEVLHKKGFSQATISRYLDQLVKEKVLEPPVIEDFHTRKFRPTKEYWDKYFQWIPIGPKANDAQYLLLSNLLTCIADMFVEASCYAVKQDYGKSVINELSTKNSKALNARISELIESTEFGLARKSEDSTKPEAVNQFLENKVIEVIGKYLDLWVFISTTKGAREGFNRRMKTIREVLKQTK
jgi:hypothetical protein